MSMVVRGQGSYAVIVMQGIALISLSMIQGSAVQSFAQTYADRILTVMSKGKNSKESVLGMKTQVKVLKRLESP